MKGGIGLEDKIFDTLNDQQKDKCNSSSLNSHGEYQESPLDLPLFITTSKERRAIEKTINKALKLGSSKT